MVGPSPQNQLRNALGRHTLATLEQAVRRKVSYSTEEAALAAALISEHDQRRAFDCIIGCDAATSAATGAATGAATSAATIM